MDGVGNVDINAGSSSVEKDEKNEKSVVKLSLTLSGCNEKVKFDTKIEARNTANQCVTTQIDISYENGQHGALEESPREVAHSEHCENEDLDEQCTENSEEKIEKPKDSNDGVCQNEASIDESYNNSAQMENDLVKWKPNCETEKYRVKGTNDNLDVGKDLTDFEEKASETKSEEFSQSLQCSDSVKNCENTKEDGVISDQSGTEMMAEGSCDETNVTEETNVLLQNIVNQTHVVEEVNFGEEIDMDSIAKEIDKADDYHANEVDNSETFRMEAERIPEKAKSIPKKVGRPKKAKSVTKSVGRSKKLITEKKTTAKNGINVNVPKKGRPKKCRISEKPTILQEPCVKKRRTNNSMAIGLDNNEESSIEFLSLRNTTCKTDVNKYTQESEGESDEINEENFEIEEDIEESFEEDDEYSKNLKNAKKNDSLVAKKTKVKLKQLEVSLTKVDIAKYKSGVTKDIDSTGEKVSTKKGTKNSTKMNEKGKTKSRKKSVKSVRLRSKDLAPVLPKYKLDYTFEVKTVGGKKTKTFYCKHCNYKSRYKCGMVRHYSIHSVPLHQCQFCDFKTRSLEGFQEHEAKHTKEKPFKCEKCDYRCRYRVDLHHHQAKHSEEKKFRCPHEGCNFVTKWKKNISHHVKGHNTTRPFVCHICSMSFKRGQTLKNHLFRHNDEKPKKCDECGFRCKSNYELRMHKTKHSDVRPFPCTFPGCEQRCKVKSDLVKHMRIHNKERNILCPLCGKGFKSIADCNKHQKRHSDIRPYGCDICGKFFRFIQGLKQHLRNHQGIKPFQCETCGHLFSNKSNKDNHVRTHNYEERPFRCPLCPYGAKNKDHLLAHIGTMHGHSYAFFCELCKKPFQRYFQLVTHHSRMHTKAEMKKFMSSIGVNMEEAQKEIKVEMVEEGLMTREQIGHMQMTLQQQQDCEEEDEEHMAELNYVQGATEQSTENTREEHTENTMEEHTENTREEHTDNTREEHTDNTREEHSENTREEHTENTREEHTENTREEHSENTTSDNAANSIPGVSQDVEREVDDTTTERTGVVGKQNEKILHGKTSEEETVPLRQVIKQEPREHVNVSATLAIYDGFRLPLFTRGFEFNPDKSGKKPRCWFMEMDNMPEDIKWHQERYFSRIGTYEAKRARAAEMKRIYEETGEVVRIDGRKGARKRKKRIENLDCDDDDLEDILAEICEDTSSQQVIETPTGENTQAGVSAAKKPRGRPQKSKTMSAAKVGKKRGRPPRSKVEEAEKGIEEYEHADGGSADADEIVDTCTPHVDETDLIEGIIRKQVKKKDSKTKKVQNQSKGVKPKMKKADDTVTKTNRKNKEDTSSLKNKRQMKSTAKQSTVTKKGTAGNKRKINTQKKGKVTTQKKKQAISKTNDEAEKDRSKCIRKVPPIRLKLQKKNKKRIWKCETTLKKVTKGSKMKNGKVSTKPAVKKRNCKKGTSRKKNQGNGFVIDWETEEQPTDSAIYEQNDLNDSEIKVEISDEVQDNYLGTEYQSNDSCAEDESKDEVQKSIASFYCDDVILMKNSRESLKVLQNPPGLSVLGIENSSSRLGTITNVEKDEKSDTKEQEHHEIVVGSSSKVCVYKNPEISNLSDIMKMHTDDLIQDICVAQEINSDVKTEPI